MDGFVWGSAGEEVADADQIEDVYEVYSGFVAVVDTIFLENGDNFVLYQFPDKDDARVGENLDETSG